MLRFIDAKFGYKSIIEPRVVRLITQKFNECCVENPR